jgi:hypothetical protein
LSGIHITAKCIKLFVSVNRFFYTPSFCGGSFSNFATFFSCEACRPSLAALQPAQPAQRDGGGILGRSGRSLRRELLDDAESRLIYVSA